MNTNYLQSLISAGNDAFSNIYKVTFSLGEFSGAGEEFTVRCKGFTIPTTSQDSYQVKYMNTKLDRPVAKVNVERHFSVTFRVDSNFEIYKLLLKQQAATFDITNDFTRIDVTSPEIDKKLFSVKVQADNTAAKEDSGLNGILEGMMWAFDKCWITDITPSGFSTENSAPLEVTVGINYLKGSEIGLYI